MEERDKTYYCDVCNRKISKKIKMQGYVLCSKHMHQLRKYGKFLDSIQRTNNDLNDYKIDYKNNTAIFNLYNQKNVKNGEFIIDLEDIEKVKYRKWRMNHNHVVTGLPAKGTTRDLSHIILDFKAENFTKGVIDHIDGNPLNNRKENLRICTQGENTLNKSFISNNTSGFIGISYNKDRDRYDPEIRINGKRCHLGYTKTLEEAVYKRYYAKTLLFGEFSNENQNNKEIEFTKNLSEETKHLLQSIVEEKLKSKNLW
jgi:hypothetical protein